MIMIKCTSESGEFNFFCGNPHCMPLDCFYIIWALRRLFTCYVTISRRKDVVHFGGKQFWEPSYAVKPPGNPLEFQRRPRRKERGPVKTGFALFYPRHDS